MLPPEVRKFLFDIAQACQLLTEFVSGKTYEDYRVDALVRSAVERQFEIIGEALRAAVQSSPELAGRITHASRIIAFRNRLIHAYASVADEVVWGVLEADLPRLTREVRELLGEPPGPQPG
ncbi:MAG: HepT-like ribonuclease domain-containing protein [Bryobacteraceae bacterium]